MATDKTQAIEIARNFVSKAAGIIYPIDISHENVEFNIGNSFSKSLGVDCPHWVITFEYILPNDVAVVSPDEVIVLVTEASGDAILATLM